MKCTRKQPQKERRRRRRRRTGRRKKKKKLLRFSPVTPEVLKEKTDYVNHEPGGNQMDKNDGNGM